MTQQLAARIRPDSVDDVLFVMAAQAEYGPELARRFTPTFIGVGPVEASMRTAVELTRREAVGALPMLVVSLGSAGSRTLTQAEVYQVTSVSYRDIDASAIGFPAGLTPFVDLPRSVGLPYRIDHTPEATLSTGGDMVSGAAYDAIDADMVDMETFGVLRACQHFGVPMLGLRGVSDGADDISHVDDWTAYLDLIDGRLATVIDRLMSSGASLAADFDPRLIDVPGGEGA